MSWREQHRVTDEEMVRIGTLLCENEPRDLALKIVRASWLAGLPTTTCPVCGIRFTGPTGYVCSITGCPGRPT